MLALASDFDKTIYFSEEDVHIKPEDIQGIAEYHKTGNLFGLCTGRLKDPMLVDAADILDVDFYILISGSLIMDKQRKIIKEKTLPYDLAKELHDKYSKVASAGILTENHMYILDDSRPYGTYVESLEKIKQEKIYGFSMELQDDKQAHDVAEDINNLYGDKVNAFQNTKYVDVVAVGCSKGSGIDFIKEYYGLEKICGIGDSFNDISMLEQADVAFTFPYAPEVVQKKADCIVNSVNEALKIMLK